MVDICAGIVECQGIDVDYTILGQFSCSLNQGLGRSHQIPLLFAASEHLAYVVEADGATELSQVVVVTLKVGSQQLGQLHHVSLTGREIEFYTLGTDAIEQRFEIGLAQLFGFDVEGEGIYPLVEDILCLGVGLSGRFGVDFCTSLDSGFLECTY